MNDEHIYDEEIDKKIYMILKTYDQSKEAILMIGNAEVKDCLIRKNYEVAIKSLQEILEKRV